MEDWSWTAFQELSIYQFILGKYWHHSPLLAWWRAAVWPKGAIVAHMPWQVSSYKIASECVVSWTLQLHFPPWKDLGAWKTSSMRTQTPLKYENSVVVPWQLDQGQCLSRYFLLDWSCTWPGCFVELGAAKNPSHLCPWILTLSQSWKQIADLAKLAPSMWKMLGIVFELQVKGYPNW